jgi:hypothetical protein
MAEAWQAGQNEDLNNCEFNEFEKENENVNRIANFRKVWQREINQPAQPGPGQHAANPVHQEAASIPRNWLEDTWKHYRHGERNPD